MSNQADTVAVVEETGHIDPALAVANESDIQEVNESVEVSESQAQEQKVPLSALQKERRKRQEIEQRNKVLEEIHLKQLQAQERPQEQDDRKYEPVTMGEFDQRIRASKTEVLREAEERVWIKQNPEKMEMLQEKLPEFLKQRPNLAAAIDASSNRYEEAWELMDKLTPKQRAALKPMQAQKKDAPLSPNSVPKAAAINQTIEFSNMTDKEFNEWRKAKIVKRK